MTINLITQDEYQKLCRIQRNFPALTFQNKGYEYIDYRGLDAIEKWKHEEVTAILKKAVVGFQKFNNFRIHGGDNRVQIRLQYQWSNAFTGVGYIYVDELLNGFDRNLWVETHNFIHSIEDESIKEQAYNLVHKWDRSGRKRSMATELSTFLDKHKANE